mmetsp:Transcript_46087/g.144564  ORF Transcript_46087/g.144564 Transcript_46087/m.144564 type:complete len:149 (+) Transcript_46087:2404-2850(+)
MSYTFPLQDHKQLFIQQQGLDACYLYTLQQSSLVLCFFTSDIVTLLSLFTFGRRFNQCIMLLPSPTAIFLLTFPGSASDISSRPPPRILSPTQETASNARLSNEMQALAPACESSRGLSLTSASSDPSAELTNRGIRASRQRTIVLVC